MAVNMNEPERFRRMSVARLSSAASNSDAETQHLELDENEAPNSVTECDWNYEEDLVEEYMRSQRRSEDVVDGGGGQVEQTPQVPGRSTSFAQPTELKTGTDSLIVGRNTKLPEVEARVQKWVNDCNTATTVVTVDENASQAPTTVILQNIELFLELCEEKLPKWTLQTNMPDLIVDEECGLETIITLLKEDNVPEALMAIIHILCAPSGEPQTITELMPVPAPTVNSAQSMMLRILNFAVQSQSDAEILSREELDTTKIEKLMLEMRAIFNHDSDYFSVFSMDQLRPKVSHKNHVILKALENYVNRSIKLALECRKTIFDIDFANMRQVVDDANNDNNNFLSTEQQCRLAKKVYTFVRKSIYVRCHNFLAGKGFDFGAVETAQELPSSMESNTPGGPLSQELSTHFGSQPDSFDIIHPNENLVFVQLDANEDFLQENGSNLAEALFDEIFYDDNAQAPILGNEPEIGRYDSLEEQDGFVSSPSYSLSLPRMSKSPTGSSEGERSQEYNQLLSFAESNIGLSQSDSSSSHSDVENGFHSEAKRNRLDLHQN